MNETQWVFEAACYRNSEEKRVEELTNIGKIVRKSLISILGLNLMPKEDPETGFLSMPKEDEFIPFSVFVGNETLLKVISDRHEQMQVQDEVSEDVRNTPTNQEMSAEEVDEFLNGGDIDFEEDPETLKKLLALKTPEAKYVMSNIVKPLEEMPDEFAPKEDKPNELKIQTDNMLNTIVSKKKKPRITISSE